MRYEILIQTGDCPPAIWDSRESRDIIYRVLSGMLKTRRNSQNKYPFPDSIDDKIDEAEKAGSVELWSEEVRPGLVTVLSLRVWTSGLFGE